MQVFLLRSVFNEICSIGLWQVPSR